MGASIHADTNGNNCDATTKKTVRLMARMMVDACGLMVLIPSCPPSVRLTDGVTWRHVYRDKVRQFRVFLLTLNREMLTQLHQKNRICYCIEYRGLVLTNHLHVWPADAEFTGTDAASAADENGDLTIASRGPWQHNLKLFPSHFLQYEHSYR